MQAIGRFAPTPSGPPHFGTLLAAIASFLHARAQGAQWLLRVENLDPPREVTGAADEMLFTLDSLGLHWDGEVMYQAQRFDAYQAALEQLLIERKAFPCACSNKNLANAKRGEEGVIYPGTCRHGLAPDQHAHSYRAAVGHTRIAFTDKVQGQITQNLETEIGDFVIRRGDGFFAYQLAVVVDDAAQGISQVVRGADLLGSTARQIHLQQLLGYPTPEYLHIPVVLDKGGNKLSKSEGAAAINPRNPVACWQQALTLLGQAPPPELLAVSELREWAVANWCPERIPKVRELPSPA
ncbi:MAG: tRNA glutamyl-Q(34) synthetase GluQRS [Nevskiales bacterium]